MQQLLQKAQDLSIWKTQPPGGKAFFGVHHDQNGNAFFRVAGGTTAENDAGCLNCCESCAQPSRPGGVQQAWMVNPDYNWTEGNFARPPMNPNHEA